MTTNVESDPVITSLARFASLPDWLAAGMDSGRVGKSLVRHVPELAAERPRLLSCTTAR